MICLRPSNDRRDDPVRPPDLIPVGQTAARIYDGRFWLAFAANFCTALAMVLLFRYADLVTWLGGGEFELGWIVGIGMAGSILMRFVLGRAIDSHGVRTVWLASYGLLAVACFGHLLLTTCHGPAIYVLRILFASAVAGVFGSALTWVGARTPTARVAEMVGMIGAAGFFSYGIGSYLGDLLATVTSGDAYIRWLFASAGCIALLAACFCTLATRGESRPPRPAPTSMAKLLWRHSSTSVLLVGIATGLVLGLPGTFVRTFSVKLGITTMATFFGAYAGMALVIRIFARRFPERFGLAPIIFLGLLLLGGGMVSFLFVQSAWQLVIPGLILGMAHGVVFPPTVAASTLSFPEHCRGLGTMLILAAYDLGVLIGAPLAGAIVRYSGRFGLPPYPTMFVTIAVLVGMISVVFAVSLLKKRAAASNSAATNAQPTGNDLPAELGPIAPVAAASSRCE